MPKVSIVIPIHDMKNGAFFLWRAINSIMEQTFKDYEVIITKEGKMAENTNAGIKKAKGEYIKILYMDDWLSNDEALEAMVVAMDNTKLNWMICSVDTNQSPYWTDDIETGNNKLGSPSALMMRNEDPLLFDERLSWLLDCDLYKRMYAEKGPMVVLHGGPYVNIGVGDHQTTNILTDEEKLSEHKLMNKKYE